MKVIINRFHHNNPDLTVEDVVQNIRIFSLVGGITKVGFTTTDKYVNISTGSYTHEQDYQGETIEITPIIHKNEQILSETDFVAYLRHPDFYRLTIIFDGVDGFVESAIGLRHEYEIYFVPNAINASALEQNAEIIFKTI